MLLTAGVIPTVVM